MDASLSNPASAACPGCTARDRRIAALEAQVARLTQRGEELSRTSKRQAAPFAKGEPKANPSQPGRKAGTSYGPKAHRPIPSTPPDEILDVPLPPCCPHCGAAGRHLVEDHVACQHQLEIPRRPIHRRFDIHLGHCHRCGKSVQPRHPLQTSDALGAAGSQLGPKAQAAVVELNKTCGLSHGKIQRVLATLLGIPLSRGGSNQVVLRAGRRCEPLYQRIVAALPQAPWVVPDETGWRVGGRLAWLHVFATRRWTGYVIDPQRGFAVAARILGEDYEGHLIHDGWAPYDRFERAEHQTCLGHLLRRCHDLLAVAVGGAVIFPRKVKALLQEGLRVRDRRDTGEILPATATLRSYQLARRMRQLVEPFKTHEANERLAVHLLKHLGQLFTFLRQPGIDATNWRAEQALRPAVVNRKVWGGNRTQAGAHAQAILMTVLRTAEQQGRQAVAFMSLTLCGRAPRLALQPAGP